MTDAGDLQRLRRRAAAGLRRAASASDHAAGRPPSLDAQPLSPRAPQAHAYTNTPDALRSPLLTLDNELALQELVNLLLPAIENALRNRRDIGAP